MHLPLASEGWLAYMTSNLRVEDDKDEDEDEDASLGRSEGLEGLDGSDDSAKSRSRDEATT
jgi:hypothetical protein